MHPRQRSWAKVTLRVYTRLIASAQWEAAAAMDQLFAAR